MSIADCPNACSQPQIKDIGIIGAVLPVLSGEECTLCNACVDTCKENAIILNTEKEIPEISMTCCVACGICIQECPTGTIIEGERGYRVQLGGKLGRHPKLAVELPGLYHLDKVLDIVSQCIEFYKENSTHGKRFADLYQSSDFLQL